MIGAPADLVRRMLRPTTGVHRVARVLLVVLITALSLVGPQMATASAVGFKCKESPTPEMPRDVQMSIFDPRSADPDTHVQPPAGMNPSGYETYGWAGLRWYTYDLGCGGDLVRAPDAVADTKVGNIFLTIGEDMTAAAIWLDQQSNTPNSTDDATEGSNNGWTKLDQIFTTISTSLKAGVYTPWIGITVMLAAVLIGYRAIKRDAAAVTRVAFLAGTAFLLGGLFVGVPQKAINFSDDTFGQLVTETQGKAFSAAGLPSRPRDVLIDRILIPDVQKGWFGPNYDDSKTKLWPDLRDSLAFTYEEQKRDAGNADAADKTAGDKEGNFTKVIDRAKKNDLSYRVFQGKDSHRTGTGFMAMLKVGGPALLWSGGSLLKIGALLAIRLAILFSPIWVPFVVVSGGLLERIGRAVGGAYLWGIAGAAIVSIYMIAIVKMYTTDHLDGTWRLWLMLFLTVVCWKILRPFKRLSQMARQDSSPVIKMPGRGGIRNKIGNITKWGAGGPVGGAADSLSDGVADTATAKTGVNGEPVADGTGFILLHKISRPADFDQWRNRTARDNLARANGGGDNGDVWTKRASGGYLFNGTGVTGSGVSSSLVDTAAASDDLNQPTRTDALQSATAGSVAPRPVRVPDVWNGGASSPIAPTKLYRPGAAATAGRSSPGTSMVVEHHFAFAPAPAPAPVAPPKESAGGGSHRRISDGGRNIWDSPTGQGWRQ